MNNKEIKNQNDKKVSLFKRIKKKFLDSAIVSSLNRFVNLLELRIKQSVFYSFMTSYGKFAHYVSQSLSGSMAHNLNSSQTPYVKKAGYKFKILTEESVLLNFLRDLPKNLLGTSLQSYGLFSFIFSLIIIVSDIVKIFILNTQVQFVEILLPSLLFVISVPALTTNESVASVINQSQIINFLLFKILGMDSIRHNDASYLNDAKKHPYLMLFLGTALGTLAIFVPCTYIFIGLGLIVLFMVIMSRPEHGISLVFLMLPFLPTMVLVGLIVLTLISQFYKVIISKRVIKISVIDVPIAAFIVSLVLSGTLSITGSNIKKMLLSVCFIFAYYLTKDLLRISKIRTNCLYSLVFSSLIVSSYGILQYFLGKSSLLWLDLSKFSDIKGRVVSTFDNPNVLAEFLIVMIPISLVSFLISKSKIFKFGSLITFILNIVCLVLTWSRGAWISFVICMLIMLVFINKKWICAYILGIVPCASALSFASGSIVNRFVSIFTFNDSSSQFRLGILEGVKKMISDNFLFGIGLGDAAFATIYPQYAVQGTQAAIHSHNLYMQIFLEQGLLGIIIFALIMLMFVLISMYYRTMNATKDDKLTSLSIFIAVLSLLIMGATDYIWYNNRIFLLFWLLIGFGVAMLSSQWYLDKADASEIYD